MATSDPKSILGQIQYLHALEHNAFLQKIEIYRKIAIGELAEACTNHSQQIMHGTEVSFDTSAYRKKNSRLPHHMPRHLNNQLYSSCLVLRVCL